ncbi:MAG: hypothetical protein FP820_02705 [Sulfurimonas sp.]|nr:hypothetical protein [Sulfurimonas sp.]MBU3939032.1 hypothetical protein [bacterium]MBU4025605.1 hypothetical protein [bacterium]MBU4059643.1 hypothetical protein [bacterium]
MNKESIYQEYKNKLPNYERAERNIKGAINEFLNDNDIPFLTVSSRIKDFDSFYNKITRKDYENPFADNEDFCGIRIILYYLDDIEKVQKIIEDNFSIQETENKSDKLELNEFGYRSNHLIIKIDSSWCVTPNYKGLEDIKIEIQIRTSLMHTWAAIEHQLGYKANQELDKKLKRKLYLISAKLEDADIQFQEVKHQADNYQKLTIQESKKAGEFVGTELNIDTLQALLKFYFPKYKEDRGMEERLLDKIIEENFTITNISSYAKQLVPYVEMIDAQVSSKEKTTRANLMNYGLEIFVPDYKVNAGDDRLKIIYSVKDTLKN